MPVLIAPVGVILVVVGQPVALVGGGTLRGALGGVAPGAEREGVLARQLLHAEEVGERVVEGALHIAAVGPAVGDAGGPGPTLFVHARAVGIHGAERVVAVGGAQRELAALCHVRGAEVVVVAAAHAGHAERVVLEGERCVVSAGHVVDAAYERIAELARLHVVHRCPVDVDVVVFLIIGAVSEPHGREQVAHLAGIDVGVGVEDGHVLRHVIIFAQLCLREGEGALVDGSGLHQCVCLLRQGNRGAAEGNDC